MADPQSLKIFVGFDFYGAGNIGDDLMVAGFLAGFSPECELELTCGLPAERIASQKIRFPSVRWLSMTGAERAGHIRASQLWLGIGGTPFQASGGRWFLKRIVSDYDVAPDTKKWMIGVGCEAEVVQEIGLARRVASETDRIWTRDEPSRAILLERLGAKADTVLSGSDLAHIALGKLFPNPTETSGSENNIGLIFYGERFAREELEEIKKFADGLMKFAKVTFLANDIRNRHFEHKVYSQMYDGFRSFLRPRPKWFAPDYLAQNIRCLVHHFEGYETVFSSRYHGLLAAAWAGCRVVAVERSSKVGFLARELGIPNVSGPITERALSGALESACRVPRARLQERRLAAKHALRELSTAVASLA